MKKKRVLVIDDDAEQLDLITRALERGGFEVEAISSPIGVSYRIRVTKPDLVLIDLDLPGIRGDKLLRIARVAATAATRFYYYSAADEDTLRDLARRDGVSFIQKTGSVSSVVQQLRLDSLQAVIERPTF